MRQRAGLRVLGLNGAQGSGKSTLAAFVAGDLQQRHGLRALAVSIDDFYLSRAARAQLATQVHPLLVTRGVPGTHDAQRGLEALRVLKSGQPCTLPGFSKADDDVTTDQRIHTAPDVVLFEGWCVGTPPQAEDALMSPVNELERHEDADGRWRRYVNQQLAGAYARWFSQLDALVYLQVPGWNEVRAWRAQQERETTARHAGRSSLQDAAALDRFLQHYQRLTQHARDTLPQRADAMLRFDTAHEVSEVILH